MPHSSHRRRRALPIIAAVVGVLLVAGGIAYAVKPDKVPDAGQVVGFTPAPSTPTVAFPTAGLSQCQLDRADRAFDTKINAVNPALVVFGDSYVAGVGADNPGEGFAYVTGKTLKLPTAALGAGGTGFVSKGACGRGGYSDRLDSLVKAAKSAKTIVVQGGLNDQGVDNATLRDAVSSFLSALDARTSGKIELLGPAIPNAGDTAKVDAVRSAYRSAARSVGVPFIDATGWLTAANRGAYVGGDGIHPNTAGHAYLAGLLVKALRTTST